MALVLVSGCGRNVPLIHIHEFSRLPLREQIAVFDDAKPKHYVLEPDIVHLLEIASHGEEAADAMTSSLKGSGPAFPPRDTVRVLEFVHFGV